MALRIPYNSVFTAWALWSLILAFSVSAAEERGTEVPEKIKSALENIAPAGHQFRQNSVRTYVQIVKGNIGRVDVEELRFGNMASLVSLLKYHADLTNATDELVLQPVRYFTNSTRHTVRYRQWIGTRPMDITSSIEFLADGTVTRLKSTIVDPQTELVPPNIQQDEAIEHVITALSNDVGYRVDDAIVSEKPPSFESWEPPTLYYRLAGKDMPPEPYWRICIWSESHGLARRAKVDALTGEVVLARSIIR